MTSTQKKPMFPTLTLEEFHRIVSQDDSVHLKVSPVPIKVDAKNTTAVTYIDIELCDHQNGGAVVGFFTTSALAQGPKALVEQAVQAHGGDGTYHQPS